MADETVDYRKPVGPTPSSTGGAPLPLQEHQRAQIQGPAVVKGDFGQDEWARMAKSAEKISAAGLTAAHAGETISGAGVQTLDVAVQQQRIAAHAEADIATTKDMADLADKHRDDPAGFDKAAAEYRAQRVANSSPGISRYVDRTVGETAARGYAGLVARKGAKDEALAKEASAQDIVLTENKLTGMFLSGTAVDADGNNTEEAHALLTKYQNQLQAGVGSTHTQEWANNKLTGFRNQLAGIQVGNNATEIAKDPEGGQQKAFDYIDEHIIRNEKFPATMQQKEHMAALARAQVHRALTATKVDAGDASLQADGMIKMMKAGDIPSLADHTAIVDKLTAAGGHGNLAKAREMIIQRGISEGVQKRIQNPDITTQRSQLNHDRNADYITETPIVAQSSSPVLQTLRAPIRAEITSNPQALKYLVARAEQEVSDHSPEGKLYFLEESGNRAINPNRPYGGSIAAAVRDPNYYPGPVDLRRATPQKIAEWQPLIEAFLNGTDTSDLSTGNASRSPKTGRMVGFGPGGQVMRRTISASGEPEHHGREAFDLPFITQLKASVESGDPDSAVQFQARGRTGAGPLTLDRASGAPPPIKPSGATATTPPKPGLGGEFTQAGIAQAIEDGTQLELEKVYKDQTKAILKGLEDNIATDPDLASVIDVARKSKDRSWAEPLLASISGHIDGRKVADMSPADRQRVLDEFQARAGESGMPPSYRVMYREALVNAMKASEKAAREDQIGYHISKGGEPPPGLRLDNAEANRISMARRKVINDFVASNSGYPTGSPFRPIEAQDIARAITTGALGETAVALDSIVNMDRQTLDATMAGDSPIKGALISAATSGDGKRMTQVMSTLSRLEANNPIAFKAMFHEGTVKNLNTWRGLKDSYTDQQIADRFARSTDPNVAAAREKKYTEGETAAKNFTINDATKGLANTNWRMFASGAPVDFEQAGGGGLMQDRLLEQFKTIYTQLYADGVSDARAKELAGKALSNEWGPSRGNSFNVMRHPPEKFPQHYPDVGGTYNYIAQQTSEFVANAQIKANNERDVAEPRTLTNKLIMGGFADKGPSFLLPPGGKDPLTSRGISYTFQSLIPDESTEADIQQGRPPSYKVLVLDHNGQQLPLPGRVIFDPKPAQAEHRAAIVPQIKASEQNLKTLTTQPVSTVPQMQALTGEGDTITEGAVAPKGGMTSAIDNEQENLVAAAGKLGGDHPVIGLIDRLHKARRAAQEGTTDEISAQKKTVK
jgi:hypothetical protein